MSHPKIPRRAERRRVLLPATCRTQSGLRDDGQLSDISQLGCCVTVSTLALRVGARIVIRPKGLEGVSGVVRWVEGQHCGIEFDTPLYEPVVDHLSALHGAGQPVRVSSW